jgi:hypothetical protein
MKSPRTPRIQLNELAPRTLTLRQLAAVTGGLRYISGTYDYNTGMCTVDTTTG